LIRIPIRKIRAIRGKELCDSRRGSEHALLMNRYDCELVRDGQKWRFKRVTIDNALVQGDPEILNALAGRQALRAKAKQSK